MMKKSPLIGILAGMGPKSTGPFIDQVVTAFQSMTGATNDIDFPPMMIYSLPTPFYIGQPVDHALMEKTICGGLKKLESCGASFIAMPCNFAHLYFSSLKRSTQVLLLNLIDLTLAAIPMHSQKVTILGTRPTIESEVYQKGLERSSLPYILKPSWQETVDELILDIKSSEDSRGLILWEVLLKEFVEEGIDTVIIACTDLNGFFKDMHIPLHVVDSSLCLAEAVVQTWQGLI